jgi:hypothetical protein
MTKYIHRQTFVDQGLRTEMLGKAANSYYVSPNDTTISHIAVCSTSRVAYTTNDPPQVLPFPGCISYGVCNQNSLVASDPTIVIPGTPFPYVSTSYVSPCKVTLYQASPSQQSAAVANAVEIVHDLEPTLSPVL